MGTQRLPFVEGGTTMPIPTTTPGEESPGEEFHIDPRLEGSTSSTATTTPIGDYSASSTVLMMKSTSSTHLHQNNHPTVVLVDKERSPSKKPLTVLNHENLKMKSLFVRRYLKHNPLINCLLPLACICALVVIVYFLKDFPKHALAWLEQRQESNSWTLVSWFMVLFVVVSFPVTVGYLVLLITSGYLFGFFRGLLVVVTGANVGVAVAHYVIRSLQNKLPVHKLIKNETGRAILRVIAGPRAFKVVLFCRLTPIPFGLQNTIFGVSNVGWRSYHTATMLGLFPAQTINVYLGSTLRSMRDVLHDHKTAFAGYAVFAVEVLVGVLLMVWVVQKARIELSNALLADIGAEEKLLTDKQFGTSKATSPGRMIHKLLKLTKRSCRRPLGQLLPFRKTAPFHLKSKSYRTV